MTGHPPQTSRPSVSIIVPTYQEAANLPVLIERLQHVREHSGLDLEVIIVDDNSRDGSAEYIASLREPWARIIVRTDERGLSSAVIRGMNEAKHDVLVCMDADLSHPPEAVPELVQRLESGADFVVGSRYVKGGSTDAAWGAFRWLNSKVATLFARPFTKICDPMSGFFALRRATYQQAERLNPIGYKIGLELLVKCRCRRVEEVPIHFADRTRGESKLSLKEQLRYVRHVGRLLQFHSPRALTAILLLTVLAAFLIPTAVFLPQQTYYVDETTQLSGLTLSPPEVTRWLMGEDARRFGVPPDRMPPLSYWAGWAWSQMFGLSEQAMRWFGVMCVGVGLIIATEAARRAFGWGAGLAAGLLIALSPNTVDMAVEIRAYPLLLLWACAGFATLLAFVNDRDRPVRWLLLMSGIGVLAAYTHFYGVVLTGALFTGALAAGLAQRRNVLPVIGLGALAMIASAGLWPFITAAVEKSGGNSVPEPPSAGDLVRFAYRSLIGHPALTTNLAIAGVAGVSFAILGVLALLRKRTGAAGSFAILVALVAGMSVAIIASFAFSAFDTLQPSYNIWRLPGVALLLASASVVAWPAGRLLAGACVVLLVCTGAYASAQLMMHGSVFAHGPHAQLAHMVDAHDSHTLSIVHDAGPIWGEMYFPLHYRFGEALTHYVCEADLALRSLPEYETVMPLTELSTQRVLVIQSAEQYWSDTAHQITHGEPEVPASPARDALIDAGWKVLEESTMPGQVAARATLLERPAHAP